MEKLLLSLVISFISFQSIATATEADDVVIVKETPNIVYENSSEHNRMNKKYEVSFMPVGFGPLPGVASALNLGFHLDRKSQLIFNVSNLSKGTTCSGSLSCSDSGNSQGLYYKRFVGNSFYFSAGIDKRAVSYNEQMKSGFGGDYNFSFDGSSWNLGLVIGNQWQWDNFTMGCDWIGFSSPISSTISNEQITDPFLLAQGTMKDKEQQYVTGRTPQALRFYIGASF